MDCFSYGLVPLAEDDPPVQREGDQTQPVGDLVDLISSELATAGTDSLLAVAGLCDILALVLPTEANEYTSVSMYHSASATEVNHRATQIAQACGHTRCKCSPESLTPSRTHILTHTSTHGSTHRVTHLSLAH